MQSFSLSPVVISFRVWIIATLLNVIIYTFLFNGYRTDIIDYILITGLIGYVISFPFFIALWILLSHFFSLGIIWFAIMRRLILIVGIFSTLTFLFSIYLWEIEFENALKFWTSVALSGVFAIVSQMRPIQKTCKISNQYS